VDNVSPDLKGGTKFSGCQREFVGNEGELLDLLGTRDGMLVGSLNTLLDGLQKLGFGGDLEGGHLSGCVVGELQIGGDIKEFGETGFMDTQVSVNFVRPWRVINNWSENITNIEGIDCTEGGSNRSIILLDVSKVPQEKTDNCECVVSELQQLQDVTTFLITFLFSQSMMSPIPRHLL